jgi:hypothetical protein
MDREIESRWGIFSLRGSVMLFPAFWLLGAAQRVLGI